MHIDPYYLKRYSKLHPKRLIYTLQARAQDRLSKFFFPEYELPKKLISNLPETPVLEWSETQVEPDHARYLLYALSLTEPLGGIVVEVGAWRGVSTAFFAKNSIRGVFAIDPWIGAGENYEAFRARTSPHCNIVPLKMTCGQAYREQLLEGASFAFIDAQHDYNSVSHDLTVITSLMKSGGLIALHDTDNPMFAGCRRAVFEQAHHYDLLAHIPNLTIFRVR